MRKKIILGMPTHFDLHKMIIKNLENENFDVFSIAMNEEFKYANLKDRIINTFYKIILNDKTYKRRKLYYKSKNEQLRPILSKHHLNHFDYALVIRPDIYPIEILEKLKKISKKSIAYQWDGIERFYGTKSRIPFFDKFFVFDYNDYSNYNTKFPNLYITNNFYSNFDSEIKTDKVDIYYLGENQKDRVSSLINILSLIDTDSLRLKLLIVNPNNKSYSHPLIKFITKPLSYDENIAIIKNSKTLIDIHPAEHSGLSFRFFECIKYKVKIITTNKSVIKHNFYTKENIFIIGKDNIEDISSFLNSAYKPLPHKTYTEYSFNSWIYNVLK